MNISHEQSWFETSKMEGGNNTVCMIFLLKNFFSQKSKTYFNIAPRQMHLVGDYPIPFIICHPPLWFSNPSLYLTTDLSV